MRRLFELLTLVFVVLIVLTISSKWSTVDNSQHSNIKVNTFAVNPFLPRDQSINSKTNNDNIIKEKLINGRPNLSKYIHLDLKGAPPQANKFYETFFDFIQKLQIGVKGVLIEYEDTLPLQGRFTNVRINKPIRY
jgi:hypothetical protein